MLTLTYVLTCAFFNIFVDFKSTQYFFVLFKNNRKKKEKILDMIRK